MTRATHTGPPVLPATTKETRAVLDPVIEATAKRRSIMQTTSAFLGIPATDLYNALRGIWTTSKAQEPLTDGEIWRGLALVARYELDPFAREIYVTRDKQGRPMIIIGVDGWIRILDRTDGYDGFDQEIVHQDDDESKPIAKVTTTIYSTKRSHPAVYVAYASDYARLGGVMLDKIPGHMLRIFSLKHAGRLFTPLGSVVTEEEAKWLGGAQPDVVPVDTLDELTEKISPSPASAAAAGAAAMVAAGGKPELSSTPIYSSSEPAADPPSPDEVKMASVFQGSLCADFAEALANANVLKDVSAIRKAIVNAVAENAITETQAGELYELALGAEDRIKKGKKK